jgi:hypothetical protein
MAEKATRRGKSNGSGASPKGKRRAAAGPGHNGGPNGSNVSDELYRRYLDKINTAEAAYDRAHERAKSLKGELRSIYSAAKDDGLNIDAVKEARAKHKLDHTTVAQDFKDVGRVLRIMKSPLATQLSLFDAPQWPPEVEAKIAGTMAGRNAEPVDNNPHNPGTAEFNSWRAGWDDGQQENREKLRD